MSHPLPLRSIWFSPSTLGPSRTVAHWTFVPLPSRHRAGRVGDALDDVRLRAALGYAHRYPDEVRRQVTANAALTPGALAKEIPPDRLVVARAR
jgi:hypothetical protein